MMDMTENPKLILESMSFLLVALFSWMQSSAWSCMPEKPRTVVAGSTDPATNQQVHHQIAITTGNITAATESRFSLRRNSFRRYPPPWLLDPKRILMLFATLDETKHGDYISPPPYVRKNSIIQATARSGRRAITETEEDDGWSREYYRRFRRKSKAYRGDTVSRHVLPVGFQTTECSFPKPEKPERVCIVHRATLIIKSAVVLASSIPFKNHSSAKVTRHDQAETGTANTYDCAASAYARSSTSVSRRKCSRKDKKQKWKSL
ncbi:hypothetical protein GOBAR_DD03244 [Gossypium barbadense]|nr:hypothetical protein GOBAR_DD03244 [Gossypium barbadense]